MNTKGENLKKKSGRHAQKSVATKWVGEESGKVGRPPEKHISRCSRMDSRSEVGDTNQKTNLNDPSKQRGYAPPPNLLFH